jgi:predicted site-specific integrase-resolvase
MGVIAAERRRFGGWTFEIGEESGSATPGEVGVWLVKAPAGSGLATGHLPQQGVPASCGHARPLHVVKLTEWARANGVHPKTAYRWWREGILPVPARKVGPCTIHVDTAAGDSAGAVGLYARVSSHDQREDLERQVARISDWAAKAGTRVVRVESEVGSGMNGARPKVRRLLADPRVSVVMVEHRDRPGLHVDYLMWLASIWSKSP